MLILSIETSCDETAAAVIKDGREILSDVVASSAQMHAKTGGIIPEKAAREQIKAIIPVIEEALKESGESKEAIDALAVTVGPGLIGSLLVGVETAKTLAYVWNKPLVPVNHLTAHIYANWLETEKEPKLPGVALVVSGGHTDLVLMRDHGKLEWIGGTRDDAAGEAFDKTARLLGLGYPGGPAIAEAAKHSTQNGKIKLPRPMIEEKNFDFSFSGLKTAVAREVTKAQPAALAYEIQEAITDVLVVKTLRAVKKYKTPTLLLAGGVAANQRLREKFGLEMREGSLRAARNLDLEIDMRVPPPYLCTDNASYIAAYAEYNFSPISWQKIAANPSLTIMGESLIFDRI